MLCMYPSKPGSNALDKPNPQKAQNSWGWMRLT